MELEMNNVLSIIIPVRDKEITRIKNCVKFLQKALAGYAEGSSQILVVDYGSETPVKLDGVKVIRIEAKEWNKAHLINSIVADISSDYVMTLDADMLIHKKHIGAIFANMGDNEVLFSTNVRRLDKKFLCEDYDKMIKNSLAWHKEGNTQYRSTADGGLQVYPVSFWKKIKGIPESLGKFWGAEDDWIWYQARLNDYTTIDISYPLLHLNHAPPKAVKTEEERNEILEWIGYKSKWLNYICENQIVKNPEPSIAGKEPCLKIYNEWKEQMKHRNEFIKLAIEKGQTDIEFLLEKYKLEKEKPSILISIINNYDSLPTYFVWDLLALYNHTRSVYPDVEIHQVNACDVNLMRNLSARYSLGENDRKKKFDYIVMLDTDHK